MNIPSKYLPEHLNDTHTCVWMCMNVCEREREGERKQGREKTLEYQYLLVSLMLAFSFSIYLSPLG